MPIFAKKRQGNTVSAKTLKYCRNYRHSFLVIAITELRYVALTVTLKIQAPMNIEKSPMF